MNYYDQLIIDNNADGIDFFPLFHDPRINPSCVIASYRKEDFLGKSIPIPKTAYMVWRIGDNGHKEYIVRQ